MSLSEQCGDECAVERPEPTEPRGFYGAVAISELDMARNRTLEQRRAHIEAKLVNFYASLLDEWERREPHA